MSGEEVCVGVPCCVLGFLLGLPLAVWVARSGGENSGRLWEELVDDRRWNRGQSLLVGLVVVCRGFRLGFVSGIEMGG